MLVPLTETAPGAGGAAISEILYAAAMATVVMAFVGWVVLRERQGHVTWVGRLADLVSRYDGLPRWVGLPSYLCLGSLLLAGFGVWWDVPIHMQNGRDIGPLANPSHYPIFLGILGFLHAGILSMGLARDPLPRRTVRLARSWRVPMGSLVITGAGLIALAGFPADDLWHRLFGQDVTQWGPTHVMMIGGAVTCILGVPLLLAEAHQVGARGTRTWRGRLHGAAMLATCIIPMAFLMEFDLGVPQYPAATQFVIAGFLMGWVFTAVRLWFGPGGALLGAGIYLGAHLAIMAAISLIPHVLRADFLLFLPGAVLVELAALVVAPRRRPLLFAAVAGLAVGTLGLYAEWQWSRYFMPLPLPVDASALPFLLTVGTLAALGGGLLGVWQVGRLLDVAADPDRPDPDEAAVRSVGGTRAGWRRQWAGLTGLAVLTALMAAFAPPSAGDGGISGTVTFSDVAYADGRAATECDGTAECLARVTVRLSPAEAARDAVWFYALAWQGRGPEGDPDVPSDPEAGAPGIFRVRMEATGEPGEYRSAHPLPMYGNWKTLLRLHRAPRTMVALALHAPDDPAIEEARGRRILVHAGDTVPVESEKQFLQREVREDVPAWLRGAAYSVVIGSWIAMALFFGWCYASAAREATRRSPRERVPA
jgi:hypothetical protein